MLPLLIAFHFFIPPQGWYAAPPKHLKPGVEVGFICSERKTFRPSINLAVEQVSVDLPAYVAALRRIHEADRTKQWIDLGHFESLAGTMHLAQIDMKAQWGEIRSLQATCVKEGKAYILTGVTSKEDSSLFNKTIVASFASFTITDDLFGTLQPEEQKTFLSLSSSLSNDKKSQEQFERKLSSLFKEKGLHWAAKAAEETFSKLN